MAGFTLLSKPRHLKKHNEAKAVDIIGIHNFSGSPNDTWKTEEGTFWLRDLLPRDFKHARIFSFGFEPLDVLSDPSKNFGYMAGDIFKSIVDVRNDIPSSRPLIILCNGLGALLVGEVLLRAKLDVLVNGQNIALRPDTLKILPGTKSNWSLGCFADGADDDYKYLVQDIKKVIRGSSKPVVTGTAISQPQQEEKIRFNLSSFERTLQPQHNQGPKVEANLTEQTPVDVSLPYIHGPPPSKKYPPPLQTDLSPVATFSASVKDKPFFHQTTNRQENGKEYARSVPTTGNTSSLNDTVNSSPKRPFPHVSGFSPPGDSSVHGAQYQTPTFSQETAPFRSQPIPQQHRAEAMTPNNQTYHPPISTTARKHQKEPSLTPYLPHNPPTNDAHQKSHAHRQDVPSQARQSYHPYGSERASDAPNFNAEKSNHLHAAYQYPIHTSPPFHPNPWNPKSIHIPPPPAINRGHRSGVNGSAPPRQAVGSEYLPPGSGSANGAMGRRPASYPIGIHPAYPPNAHPYPQPQPTRGNARHSTQFQPPPGMGYDGVYPTQFNVPPMYGPPGHAPPQDRYMAPPSSHGAPPWSEKAAKAAKVSSPKESKTSKSSKFPKDSKSRKGGESSMIFDELATSNVLRASTALHEHGLLGVSKTLYNAGLTLSTPIAKALGKEKRHAGSRKSRHLSGLVGRGERNEDSGRAHKAHSHRSRSDASKSKSGHRHTEEPHPRRSQKDHGHAKDRSLKSHVRHARSHAHHDHDKHDRKHRRGSFSSLSSISAPSNASIKSSDSSGSEESDYEEPTANPNENKINERIQEDRNHKANAQPHGHNGERGKHSRNRYDSDSASDDNDSISNASIVSEIGMDDELEIDADD